MQRFVDRAILRDARATQLSSSYLLGCFRGLNQLNFSEIQIAYLTYNHPKHQHIIANMGPTLFNPIYLYLNY